MLFSNRSKVVFRRYWNNLWPPTVANVTSYDQKAGRYETRNLFHWSQMLILAAKPNAYPSLRGRLPFKFSHDEWRIWTSADVANAQKVFPTIYKVDWYLGTLHTLRHIWDSVQRKADGVGYRNAHKAMPSSPPPSKQQTDPKSRS